MHLIPSCHRAHQVAFEKGSQLHTDISVGNIIITDDGRGMLIDWELSKDVKREGFQIGTSSWKFKSTVGDDLESFLWVSSWVVGRNAPSAMTDDACAAFHPAFHPWRSAKKTQDTTR
ncbi:hypothetical protein D9757_010460 [Collybiopsis confluens]|uniref:Protein kinase domain-containing protein n=1 Tax=Collybiopsis confluens TaxID=2823264 RepID=A0A8H5LU31_9AGAR|nr:hypothetical protein D9757_010460 [Collybiopsis confluens]